jgi:hypothetical protein
MTEGPRETETLKGSSFRDIPNSFGESEEVSNGRFTSTEGCFPLTILLTRGDYEFLSPSP